MIYRLHLSLKWDIQKENQCLLLIVLSVFVFSLHLSLNLCFGEAGTQGCKSSVWGPKQTSFSPSVLTKSKGRETSGGKTRKDFISVRPTQGRQQTSVSTTVPKMLKILPGVRRMRGKGSQLCAGGPYRSGRSLSWGQSRGVLQA